MAESSTELTQGWRWGGWAQTAGDGTINYATLLPSAFQGAVTFRFSTPAPAPPNAETRDKLLTALSSWGFNPLVLSSVDVYHCACLLFQAVLTLPGFCNNQSIPFEDFRAFLWSLRALYPENPYHNFKHAVDVLQATYTFLRPLVPPIDVLSRPVSGAYDPKLPSDHPLYALKPLDVLCLMLSAIAHDTAHPGVTAIFLANVKAPLTAVAPHSPLETLHFTLFLHLLRSHNLDNVLQLEDTTNYSLIQDIILITDMQRHGEWLAKFKRITEDNKPVPAGLICQAIIKAADISNPTRRLPASVHWSSVLITEWSNQNAVENSLQLPMTVPAAKQPGTLDYEMAQAKGQIGFVNACVLPLFDAVSAVIPDMEPYAQNCRDNLAVWKKRVDVLTTTGQVPNDGWPYLSGN